MVASIIFAARPILPDPDTPSSLLRVILVAMDIQIMLYDVSSKTNVPVSVICKAARRLGLRYLQAVAEMLSFR